MVKKTLALFCLAAALSSGGLVAESGDLVASIGAADAASFGLPGGQSFSLVAPVEMSIVQDQTLFAPVYNSDLGQIFFEDSIGASAGGTPKDALDYLIVDVDQMGLLRRHARY
jgi:hypothetical protein